MHNPHQGKSTPGCDDQYEDPYEWAAVPEPEPVPLRAIAAFLAFGIGTFVAFVTAANLLVWALSMIGGA